MSYIQRDAEPRQPGRPHGPPAQAAAPPVCSRGAACVVRSQTRWGCWLPGPLCLDQDTKPPGLRLLIGERQNPAPPPTSRGREGLCSGGGARLTIGRKRAKSRHTGKHVTLAPGPGTAWRQAHVAAPHPGPQNRNQAAEKSPKRGSRNPEAPRNTSASCQTTSCHEKMPFNGLESRMWK